MSPLAGDFVDHYRETGDDFDYALEERWVRDEGYLAFLPNAIRLALERAAVTPARVTHFVAARRGARRAVDRTGRGPAGGERRRGPRSPPAATPACRIRCCCSRAALERATPAT